MDVSEIFNLDDIRAINNAWTECPYNEENLKVFFDVESLKKRVKTNVFLIDVNE